MRTSTTAAPWRLLPAVALLLLAPYASAEEVSTVLGHDGTVFRLQQAAYGELFEGGVEADPDSPVLALELRQSDGASELLLVPGTETDDQESSASMVFEDTAGVVYLVWETLFNGQHPLLHLTSFDGGAWSELIQITSNVYADKGAPQLVVRSETDVIVEDDVERELNRTTLHLSWWEESVDVSRKQHALIILEDGRYLGWAPILELGDYVLEDDTSVPPAVPGLENALSLQTGHNHRTAVAGFVNSHTYRLVTLEIGAISQVIGNIADRIRAQVIVIGLNAGSLSELAEMAREEVLDQGEPFHEAARFYLAERVASTVSESEVEFTPAGIVSIAELIRAQVIVIGMRIGLGGLTDARSSEVIQVGQSPTEGGEPYHYYQVSVVSDREAPEVGGPAKLLLSESGENVVVAWEDETHVYYRESVDEGWSEPTSIKLTEDLDRETVYRMLAERVRGE